MPSSRSDVGSGIGLDDDNGSGDEDGLIITIVAAIGAIAVTFLHKISYQTFDQCILGREGNINTVYDSTGSS